ncbi:MAG: phage tail protein [Bryobacteraceae bacterium]
MENKRSAGKSLLLDYLPAIYQGSGWVDADAKASSFLSSFLLAFEKILLGRDDAVEPTGDSPPFVGSGSSQRFQGLEEKIANLSALFDARRAPEEFLEWLAGWGALSLHEELSVPARRVLIANIISLYRIRGTKHYLERLLELVIGGGAVVDDQSWPGIQIGNFSTLSRDTYLAGSAPHYFRVKLAVPPGDDARARTRLRMARDVIELAKPAHTYYDLESHFSRMQVGLHSCVAVDTFLA